MIWLPSCFPALLPSKNIIAWRRPASAIDDERVELLDGVVVRMPPTGIPHWSRHGAIVRYLNSLIGDLAAVHGQISLSLGDSSEPEPDIAILALLDYEGRRVAPAPNEIYAMIELSQSSLLKDTRTKRRLYARFEIADYIVVDLAKNEVILDFSRPRAGDYTVTRRFGHGKTFAIAAVPEIAFSSDAFLTSGTGSGSRRV